MIKRRYSFPMVSTKQADILYALYSKSFWAGENEHSSKLRRKWLIELQKAPPSSPFESFYNNRIRTLLKNRISTTFDLERTLLDRRFNFTADINGKNYSYRELQSLTGTDRNEALIIESEQLISNGFAELVKARNIRAKSKGFPNYWYLKNKLYGEEIEKFLITLDRDLISKRFSESENPAAGTKVVSFKEAFEFYCSFLFSETVIPKIEIFTRTGDNCPPGPPYVQPLVYRPEKGHIIGLNIPFIREGSMDKTKLGSFFHELTHLFHFASVDSRGGYAFSPELARNDLIYESEALCYQNLILSAQNRTPYTGNLQMLKDLVYVAETERQLYLLKLQDEKSIRELLYRRIEEHYPERNFKRSPLGASHIIREESSGRYWIYVAAHHLADKRIAQILITEQFISKPYFWSEGNEASWRIKSEEKLNNRDTNILFSRSPIDPLNLGTKNITEIQREIENKIVFSID